MTISVKHAFTSPKVDGGDTTLIRPSNWNAEHTILCATDKLLGRATSGTGAVEEIACTAAARSILDDASIAAILETLGVSPPTTGDLRLTLKTTATTGWVMFNDGTIGDASSSASSRANADCEGLFTLIFDNLSDANAPILTSGGVATTRVAQTNAATAWAAHCRISLPKVLGRALAVAGAGSGLTSRALGAAVGAETNTIAQNQLPNVAPTFTGTIGAVTVYPGGNTGYYYPLYTANSWTAFNPNAGSGGSFFMPTIVGGAPSSTNSMSGVFTPVGSVSSINGNVAQQTLANVQPTTFLNVMVKL